MPDIEVARALLPDARSRHLSNEEALKAIAAGKGVVPIAVDPKAGGPVYWADIGDYSFREWQYTYTIKHLAQTGAIRTAFTSDFDLLADDTVGAEGIQPSAFVFHIARCGSTLLAKALARVDSHVVVNQGLPLQRGFWARLTDGFRAPLEPTPENLRAFRNIVLAMTRKRSAAQKTAFVKLVSWNSVYIDFIRQAFPDVPAIFLYRNPAEVIASIVKSPTPASLAKGSPQAELVAGHGAKSTREMSDVEYLARSCANYFETALANVPGGLTVLNYRAISRANFPAILERGLGVSLAAEDFAVAQEQFSFHSKDDGDAKQFQSDEAVKKKSIAADDQAMIDAICGDLVAQLDSCPGNLFGPVVGKG